LSVQLDTFRRSTRIEPGHVLLPFAPLRFLDAFGRAAEKGAVAGGGPINDRQRTVHLQRHGLPVPGTVARAGIDQIAFTRPACQRSAQYRIASNPPSQKRTDRDSRLLTAHRSAIFGNFPSSPTPKRMRLRPNHPHFKPRLSFYTMRAPFSAISPPPRRPNGRACAPTTPILSAG
jgi:hypothetical protein